MKKTQRAKKESQETTKSHGAKEAVSPPIGGGDTSPYGLPGFCDASALSSHGIGESRDVKVAITEGHHGIGENGEIGDTKVAVTEGGHGISERVAITDGSHGLGESGEIGDTKVAVTEGSHGIGERGESDDTKVVVTEDIQPWDWIQTPIGRMQWGHFCRGGGGNGELLAGLQELLAKAKKNDLGDKGAKFVATSPTLSSASSATVTGAAKGKGQGNVIKNDAELLGALEGVVKAAKKDPGVLLDALQGLIKRAMAGYGQGLIGFGMAKKRLSDGDKLNAHLIVACEQSELDALLSLARAHALQDKISVVCRFNPEQEAAALQLPSSGPKGQRQVRSWPAMPLGSSGGPDMKHRAVLRSAFKAPDRKLVTLRLQVPKVFQEPTTWTAFCKQPNDRARHALGPIHSFGPWQKLQAGEKHSREEVLECYVKVAEVDKAAVLSRSGVEGVFAAELAKDAQKPVVDWLSAGETERPAYLMLARRKAQETKSSLAFRRGGGASLGVKVSAEAAGDRTCAWRARQVPHDWSAEDLQGALADVGFAEFEVLSPGRGRLPWLVRARFKQDGGQPSLAIQVGKVTIDMERAITKRKLVPSHRAKEVAQLQLDRAKQRPKAAKRRAPTLTMDVDDKLVLVPEPKNALDPPLVETTNGATFTNVGGQGGASSTRWACALQFIVFGSHGRMRVKLAKARGATLRAANASYVRDKASDFKLFWLPAPTPADETERVNLELIEGGTPPQSWEEYLDALDRPTRWADDLTFRAATKRLNCRIILVVGDVKKPTQIIAYGKAIQFKDGRQQVVIPLLYKDKHCQLIAPKNGKSLPAEWTELETGGQAHTLPRGLRWHLLLRLRETEMIASGCLLELPRCARALSPHTPRRVHGTVRSARNTCGLVLIAKITGMVFRKHALHILLVDILIALLLTSLEFGKWPRLTVAVDKCFVVRVIGLRGVDCSNAFGAFLTRRASSQALDRSCPTWSCFHLNTGGCANAFETLELFQTFKTQPSVWSLAEIRASPSEQTALTKRANRMGYRVWCVPSTQGARQQGPTNWKGGLLVGVKEGVCCKQMATWCCEEGDLLQLDFGYFRYVAAWRRPGGLRDAFDAEVTLWASHAVATGHSFEQGRYLASRWKGPRAIDWAMNNDPQATFKAEFLEPRISDHKCLWIEGSFGFERVGQFSLRRTRDLSRPEHVPLTTWREAVAAYFHDLEVVWGDDVDVQWAQLAAQLELSLEAASQMFAETTSARPLSRGKHRPKGSVATLAAASGDPACKGHNTNEGAQLRKLSTCLGRLHEAKRLQQHPVADGAEVMAKLRATWPSDLSASNIDAAILECEANILKLRQQRRDFGLTSWRAKMAQGRREATRWLRNKAGLLAPALQSTVRGVTTTSSSTPGSLELIVAFWRKVWQRQLPDDLHEQLGQMWAEHPPPQAAWPGDQGPLQAHEMMQRARSHSKSSAGPDGISAENLADMPEQWWAMLAQLLQSWTAQNKFPISWRGARMVLIPKDEVTGAAAEVCPPYFQGGVVGRNAWQALRHIEASWDEEAILVSFDFEKCFDNVVPALALDNLRRHGCPENFLRVVAWTWLEQRRWIQYGSFVHPEPQRVTSSLPQGCPASSAVTKSADDTARVINFWASAARAFGLQENRDKLKVVSGPRLDRTMILPQLLWSFWWSPHSSNEVQDFHKLTTLVKRALDIVQQGSRDLWLLLAGHWMDVGFALRMASASAFFKADAFWRGHGRRLVTGRWGLAVASFLQHFDFIRTGAHTWQHAVVGDFDLSGGDMANRSKALHLLREAGRRQRHASFLQGRRRELADLVPDDAGYDENVLKAAIKLYNGASNEECRVMLGGCISERNWSNTKQHATSWGLLRDHIRCTVRPQMRPSSFVAVIRLCFCRLPETAKGGNAYICGVIEVVDIIFVAILFLLLVYALYIVWSQVQDFTLGGSTKFSDLEESYGSMEAKKLLEASHNILSSHSDEGLGAVFSDLQGGGGGRGTTSSGFGDGTKIFGYKHELQFPPPK
ncbi:unnamed protein product [Symbiodinium sp. CCMP2456]|nr:unnamed protein product [Symbiodinium sp. CCMP2456]